MKYIKTFESLNKEKPEIGDYIQIIIDGKDHTDIYFLKLIDFLFNNIGIVINTFNNFTIDNDVRIKYKYVPNDIIQYFDSIFGIYDPQYSKRLDLNFVDDYVIGKTSEEVRIKMASNKFNL